MIKLIDLIKEQFGGKKYSLPPDHKPFMYSPKGFSCHVCEYYYMEDNKHKCRSKEYQEFKGTDELVDDRGNQIKDPKKWCSDWFEPK